MNQLILDKQDAILMTLFCEEFDKRMNKSGGERIMLTKDEVVYRMLYMDAGMLSIPSHNNRYTCESDWDGKESLVGNLQLCH